MTHSGMGTQTQVAGIRSRCGVKAEVNLFENKIARAAVDNSSTSSLRTKLS